VAVLIQETREFLNGKSED